MTTEAERIRRELGHPIIDVDGHVLEFMPAALPYLRDALGPSLFERYQQARSPVHQATWSPTAEQRARSRTPQAAWWGSPVANTVDLATAMIPRLLAERLGELGIDYAVVYPTLGLGSAGISDPELRVGVCRGFNRFLADTYGPYRDRLTPAAIIPMHTPEEALDELEHCRGLGMKVASISQGVLRPIEAPAPEGSSPWLWPNQTHWWDRFGLDSAYDYDPVWAAFERLGLVVTAHGGLGSAPTGIYESTSSFMANHVGQFATMMHSLCKSLFFGGVTRRFPGLNISFLECGVGWAGILLGDIIEHWERRNLAALRRQFDPAHFDAEALAALVRHWGPELVASVPGDLVDAVGSIPLWGVAPEELDEFLHLQAADEAALAGLFTRSFHFGCEADDRSVAYAYSPANPLGAEFKAMFSSDISHFDVPDMAKVVPDAYQLLTQGLLSAEQFRRFSYANAVHCFGEPDPSFFVGTVLEAAAAAELATGPVAGPAS